MDVSAPKGNGNRPSAWRLHIHPTHTFDLCTAYRLISFKEKVQQQQQADVGHHSSAIGCERMNVTLYKVFWVFWVSFDLATFRVNIFRHVNPLLMPASSLTFVKRICQVRKRIKVCFMDFFKESRNEIWSLAKTNWFSFGKRSRQRFWSDWGLFLQRFKGRFLLSPCLNDTHKLTITF